MAYLGMSFINAAAPPQMQRASILLYTGLALSLASHIVEHANDDDGWSWGMLVLLAGYAALLWISACVANGRKWARLTFTLLTLFVSLTALAVIATLGLGGPPWGVATLLDFLAFATDACALFLVWTKPGSDWFRKVDRTEAAAVAE